MLRQLLVLRLEVAQDFVCCRVEKQSLLLVHQRVNQFIQRTKESRHNTILRALIVVKTYNTPTVTHM